MTKDEQLLQSRLIELSKIAYHRGIVMYSDFLNLNELNILHCIPKNELYCSYECYGGYNYSERQMAAFLPDALCCTKKSDYPITPLEIRPLNKKFSDSLTHRDYLGSLMNLGIERKLLGDIIIDKDSHTAVVFSQRRSADYIMSNLTRIRHTSVIAVPATDDYNDYQPSFQSVTGTVASIRLDALMSVAFPMSRSKLTPLITEGRVYLNGRLITANSCTVEEGDIISVRGMGRFLLYQIGSQSKKGRYFVVVRKYI